MRGSWVRLKRRESATCFEKKNRIIAPGTVVECCVFSNTWATAEKHMKLILFGFKVWNVSNCLILRTSEVEGRGIELRSVSYSIDARASSNFPHHFRFCLKHPRAKFLNSNNTSRSLNYISIPFFKQRGLEVAYSPAGLVPLGEMEGSGLRI